MNKEPIIAYCGLYCSNCRKYKNGKCPGCQKNTKASWCKIRTCNINQSFNSCAECSSPGVKQCKVFNNPVSKLFAFVFNSDREATINLLNNNGVDSYLKHMNETGRMVLPRQKK